MPAIFSLLLKRVFSSAHLRERRVIELAELQEAHHTFGLVVDYACLPQKPFASDEEAQRADHPAGPSPAGSLLALLLGPCPARPMAVGLSAPSLPSSEPLR